MGSARDLFQTVAEPLRELSRKGEKFEWSEEEGQAFQTLKQKVAEKSMLPYFDRDAQTRFIADASLVGLGAVLVQEVKGQSSAVCYASRRLSERRYSHTKKQKKL